jgi:DNA invertase Pin-like site-specific DNA recombinase
VLEATLPDPRRRLAVVYVRQSSPQQTLVNRESLELQYNLRDKAAAAGWPAGQVRVIDADLGRTGRTTAGRLGFQELVTLVNQGQVGIIFAYDVTRLARNCTDWYALLDLCGWRHCLVGDQDGIYDPVTANGRLILGLKGLISELELHTLRARLTAGLLNKARRGELAVILPIGLVRDACGRVSKHPDREVQSRLDLVFTTFLRVKAAGQVVRFFDEHALLLPRRDRFGDLAWRRPTVVAVLSILHNPAYAGAFVYGRTRTAPGPAAAPGRARQRLQPAEWKILVPDKYPAYIPWATYETIQAMIRDNHSEYERKKNRGIPRSGKALLHGIVWCGECGHKMAVTYKKGPCYVCNALRQQSHAPVCQNVPAGPIDSRVVDAFFAALSPLEVDLYDKAVAALRRDDERLRQAQQQQLERLRYQARLAERQFHQADPDNRLVSAELERRWEVALRELQEAEERCRREQRPAAGEAMSPEEREAFGQAGKAIPDLWRQGRLTAQQQKAFLRCLIDKVVAHRSSPDTVQVRIIWRGGDTTAESVPVPVATVARLSCAADMEREIIDLAKEGKSDEEIAALLTKKGYRSSRRTVVQPRTVRVVRLRHRQYRQPGQSHRRQVPGYLTVSQLADRLGVEPDWLYYQIQKGALVVGRDTETNLYLFPDKPETITRFQQLRAGKVQKLHF